jgi:membrane-associated protease RseP (regulator of RpoE activity)
MMGKRMAPVAIAVAALLAVVGGVIIFKAIDHGSGSTSASAASPPDGSGSQSSVSAQDESAKPWLGVMVRETPDGVTIAQVIADSPADQAGLKRGDVIKAVDGTAADNVKSFRDQIEGKAAGDSVEISISRDGKDQDVSVTLEARPEPLPVANPVLPELNGIPRDELFSHLMGGSLQFTDADGNTHSVTVDLGTVASVDADAKTIKVDLNSGDSKDYKITDGVIAVPSDLSQFQAGDPVTIVSVDDNVRAVTRGGKAFFPDFGGMHGGFGFGHGRFGHGGFWNGDHGWFSPPDVAPTPTASGSGL